MGLGRSQNVEQRLPEEKRSRKKASYRSNGEHSLAFLCHMNTHTSRHPHPIKETQKLSRRPQHSRISQCDVFRDSNGYEGHCLLRYMAHTHRSVRTLTHSQQRPHSC